METLERQQRKIADKYKRNLKKTNDQFFKLQKTVKDKFVIEDEEQEEAMKVYNDAKHKMECKKKEKEREVRITVRSITANVNYFFLAENCGEI